MTFTRKISARLNLNWSTKIIEMAVKISLSQMEDRKCVLDEIKYAKSDNRRPHLREEFFVNERKSWERKINGKSLSPHVVWSKWKYVKRREWKCSERGERRENLLIFPLPFMKKFYSLSHSHPHVTILFLYTYQMC